MSLFQVLEPHCQRISVRVFGVPESTPDSNQIVLDLHF